MVGVVDLVGIYRGQTTTPSACRFAFAPGRRPPASAGTERPDIRWSGRDELDRIPIHPAARRRIGHGLEARPMPYIEVRRHRPASLRRRLTRLI
jgi:hypothetical protein